MLKRLYSEKWYSSLRYEVCLRVALWDYRILLLACLLIILIPSELFSYDLWRFIKYQQTQNSWMLSVITMISQVPDSVIALLLTFYNLFVISIAVIYCIYVYKYFMHTCIYSFIHSSYIYGIFILEIQRWKDIFLVLPCALTPLCTHLYHRCTCWAAPGGWFDSLEFCLMALWRLAPNICGPGKEYKWKSIHYASNYLKVIY